MSSSVGILFYAVAVIIGITVHEFSHALVAVQLGDSTPRLTGRLTLNPAAHFDPFGALLFVLTLFGFAPFAYGKPVLINPLQIRGGRQGVMLVSLAGPFSNLLIAIFFALLIKILPLPILALNLFSIIVISNVYLALFNLLPVPPLDGYKIVLGVLPYEQARAFQQLQQYAFLFLLVIIYAAGSIISPIANFIINLLL